MSGKKLNQTPLAATVAQGRLDSTQNIEGSDDIDNLIATTRKDSGSSTETTGNTGNDARKKLDGETLYTENENEDETDAPALREGSTLYYATLRMGETDRQRVVNALVLLKTLSTCLHGVQEPVVAQTKLQWWSDEINRLALNEARHPVMKRCAAELSGNAPAQRHLNTVLDAATAARFDAPDDDASWRELVCRDYAARLSLLECSIRIKRADASDKLYTPSEGRLEGRITDQPTPLDTLALATGWMDILSALPTRIHHDDVALPPSLYDKFELSRKELLAHLRSHSATPPAPEKRDSVRALLNAAIHQAATVMESAVQSADSALNPTGNASQQPDKHTRALVTWLHLKNAQLALWQKSPPDLLKETRTLTPLKKWYLAFRHR